MQFDPDALVVHQAMLSARLPRLESLTPAAARALLAELRARAKPVPAPAVEVQDFPAKRLYRPRSGTLPIAVFLHGGGWVLGDLDTHDALCRHLAVASGCAVLAVDYRLAPEHPFPAALEDAAAALHWLADNATALDLDPARLAVVGDSAGGNLAAALALMARDGDVPPLAVQVLAYPVVDVSLSQPSHGLDVEGLALNGATMRWFRDHYLQGAPGDWRAAPLTVPSLRGVAPCVLLTAGIDPLCDEGLAYASRLAAEGVRLEHRHYPGQIHGFLTAALALPTAQREIARIGAALAEHLEAPNAA